MNKKIVLFFIIVFAFVIGVFVGIIYKKDKAPIKVVKQYRYSPYSWSYTNEIEKLITNGKKYIDNNKKISFIYPKNYLIITDSHFPLFIIQNPTKYTIDMVNDYLNCEKGPPEGICRESLITDIEISVDDAGEDYVSGEEKNCSSPEIYNNKKIYSCFEANIAGHPQSVFYVFDQNDFKRSFTLSADQYFTNKDAIQLIIETLEFI